MLTNGQNETPKSDSPSNENSGKKPDDLSQKTSNDFAPLLKDSSKSFPKPNSLAQLTAQLNYVGTAILNGEANIEVARAYGAIVRTAAQLFTAEMTRARMVKERPDLSFLEDDIFDE